MLSIITHFKNTAPDRMANLLYTLGWLHAQFPEAEIICVEQDTETQLPKYVDRLSVTIDAGHNKPLCVNMGVEAAANEWLLILDPDTLFDTASITEGVPDDTWVVPLNMQLRLTKEETAKVLGSEINVAAYVKERFGTGTGHVLGSRATTGGVQYLTKTMFNKAGRMNVEIKNHPWDISGFQTRFQKAGGKIVMIQTPGVHLHHAPGPK